MQTNQHISNLTAHTPQDMPDADLPQDGIPIRFNHETMILPREEAARLAQIGKFAEGKEDLIRGAEKLFRQSGCETYAQWLQMTDAAPRNPYDAQRLAEAEQSDRAERTREMQPVLEQMEALREKYPEADLNALPDEVAEFAVQYGVPLVVAYENACLLPRLQKEVRAQRLRENNRRAAVGSMHSCSGDNVQTLFDQQWKEGIWG